MPATPPEVLVPERYMVQLPFPENELGIKRRFLDHLPTKNVAEGDERILGAASAMLSAMLARDAKMPVGTGEEFFYLGAEKRIFTQVNREEYTEKDFGSDAEAIYREDLETHKKKIRSESQTMLGSTRGGWAQSPGSGPQIELRTIPSDEKALPYELVLMGNNSGGSPFQTEVFPGIRSIAIRETGEIVFKGADARPLENVPEELKNQTAALLDSLKAKALENASRQE